MVHYFSPQPASSERPARLANPFDNRPHSLAIRASDLLQQTLKSTPHLVQHMWQEAGGKMFGVLVVSDPAGRLGYLAGFSGMLNQSWLVPGFVPPLFEAGKLRDLLCHGEQALQDLSVRIQSLTDSPQREIARDSLSNLIRQKEHELQVLKQRNVENREYRKRERLQLVDDHHKEALLINLSFRSQQDKREYKQCRRDWDLKLKHAANDFELAFDRQLNELRKQRKALSRKLHRQVFDHYCIKNGLGEKVNIRTLFDGNDPPGGAGDCAAPKLIQYAHERGLKPLALAEFWWGASPGKEIRHHGSFYPPCRGKCHPILPYMLQGIDHEELKSCAIGKILEPGIIYEDNALIVLEKPAGLLSVPGKEQQYSVLSWLQQRYPNATGPLLVHRLDMATSGLLLAAKNARAHKKLQKQFIERSVKKRYVAVLSKQLSTREICIQLPLRVDLEDRPRQLVCYEHGKSAVTRVKVISRSQHTSRVNLYPLTGRTHQLRVHAAHPDGLDAPIVGDELYGVAANRLMLHAERIGFNHPVTGNRINFESNAPF